MEDINFQKEDVKNPLYDIKLTKKATEVLEHRRRTLYAMERLNWVEDGIQLVIYQFMHGSGKVSDYLRIGYDNCLPEEKRRNDTEGERKPLKYRFKYLFRCLELTAECYEELEQWKFSGVQFALEALVEVVRQALGEEVAKRLDAFFEQFRGIWKAVNPSINSPEDFRKAVRSLVDEVESVFEVMLAECLRRETMAEMSRCRENRMDAAVESLERVAAECRDAAREQRRTAKVVAKVAGVAASRPEVAKDVYGRYAGLEDFNESQRTELKAAIDMSHRDYALLRNPKRGGHSLRGLGERCWNANRDRFEELAKLPVGKGYANKAAYVAALYRLDRRYPAADHFRWQD